ncbi:MAG: hypothetical protein ACRD2W_07995, partial [Acidimicrobiales bacterium]
TGPCAAHFDLYDGDRLVRGNMSPAIAVRMVLWQVNQVALASASHVVLHAGCVARGDRALVLGGPMDAGKSTLVAGLVRRGMEYMSDEFAPVSLASGSVVAYPCPLALEPGSFPMFPELRPDVGAELVDDARWSVAPNLLGAVHAAGRPARPAAVVFPLYSPHAAPRVDRLPPRTAIARLVGQTLNLARVGGAGFRALAELAMTTACYELSFSDLEVACARLMGLLPEAAA